MQTFHLLLIHMTNFRVIYDMKMIHSNCHSFKAGIKIFTKGCDIIQASTQMWSVWVKISTNMEIFMHSMSSMEWNIVTRWAHKPFSNISAKHTFFCSDKTGMFSDFSKCQIFLNCTWGLSSWLVGLEPPLESCSQATRCKYGGDLWDFAQHWLLWVRLVGK